MGTEEISRWADYTEELYKKTLNTPDKNESSVTDLELEILESEVRKAM